MSRHQSDGEPVDVVAAGDWAAAAVVAVLDADDWPISHDAKAMMSEMVTRLGGGATEVSVLVHRDQVELVAAAGGRLEMGVLPASRPFSTSIDCTSD